MKTHITPMDEVLDYLYFWKTTLPTNEDQLKCIDTFIDAINNTFLKKEKFFVEQTFIAGVFEKDLADRNKIAPNMEKWINKHYDEKL